MQNYKVMVISKENLNVIIGPEDREHTIYLYSHDDHYDLVTSLSAFYQNSYSCVKCLKGYDSKLNHKCQNTCMLCRSDDCPSTIQQEEFKHCDKCNRNFKDDQCFQNHIDTNVCSKYFKCKHCDVLCSVKLLKKSIKRVIVCGTTLCKMCKRFVFAGHQCYMQKVRPESESENTDNVSETENNDVCADASEGEKIDDDDGERNRNGSRRWGVTLPREVRTRATRKRIRKRKRKRKRKAGLNIYFFILNALRILVSTYPISA